MLLSNNVVLFFFRLGHEKTKTNAPIYMWKIPVSF